jgi:hypothetical protein
MIRNLATWEKRMRVIALLPATCLALLATSGLAQQAAPPPSPSSGQGTGLGEKALPPAVQGSVQEVLQIGLTGWSWQVGGV